LVLNEAIEADGIIAEDHAADRFGAIARDFAGGRHACQRQR
jgi:hypothetical protein